MTNIRWRATTKTGRLHAFDADSRRDMIPSECGHVETGPLCEIEWLRLKLEPVFTEIPEVDACAFCRRVLGLGRRSGEAKS